MFGRKEMTKFTLSLAIGLAILAWSGSPAKAEPVPDRAIGTWSAGSCGADGLTVLVSRKTALMIESEGADTSVTIAGVEWVGSSFVLTIEGEENELVLPPLESLERCASPPSSLALLFAESVVVFKELDKIDAYCRGEDGITPECLAVAFDLIDITGDGEFSRAELSRALRAASFFIGYRLVADEQKNAVVPLEKLYIAQLAASAFGPLVAGNLIQSYDFDGNGLLALNELLQDRTPEKGLEGIAARFAMEVSPELASTLMKPIIGMLGLLW